MRKSIALIISGFLLVTMAGEATADGIPRKRIRPVNKSAAAPPDAKLHELLRQTQQDAEAARDEARQAREQSESLSLKLEQTARELAELRAMIDRRQSQNLESQIAEIKSQVAEIKSAMEEGAPTPKLLAALEPKTEERLVTLEEQVEVNTAQIKEQAQTKVESDSRFRIRLTGALLVNTYLNSSDSANSDLPLIASPASVTTGQKRHNLGATLRQSRIGLVLTGPRVGNARLSAEADFDFWGGPATGRTEGDVLGVFRIRTASARLDWERTSLEVGQTAPVISPLSPNSLAAVWYPALSAAGNLWQWRPHLTLEHRVPFAGASELVLKSSLMPNFNETFRGETLEGDPGYAGRVAFRRTLGNDRQIEIGLGGYGERRKFRFSKSVNSFALTGDWTIPVGSRLTFNGEAYYGRSINLGELSGGRIDRLYALATPTLTAASEIRGIRTRGGWAQLSFEARRDLEFNLAFGKDDPNNDDVRFGTIGNFTRSKNQAGSANFIYQLRQNFQMSLEYRRLWTDYAPGRRTNNHYNLAFGYLF